ncbi:MAG TPA: 50S ribosomal protein L22 [Candidatus Paceibacterota bacterium]|nr:50S ribosomal protein L22 [Candidatus Paceibacterota bacterium]
MADSTASLKNYRQSPRKVRLVADLIRGKSADRALALLNTLPKRASDPVAKLLLSAIANAKQAAPQSELYVSSIQVNGGIVFKRSMPRARGRASAIRKRTSHITLALSRKAESQKARSASSKAQK